MWLRVAVCVCFVCTTLAAADGPPAFAAASIKPSEAEVPFDRDGRVEIAPGTLRMRDVRVLTCIKWAYGVQDNQVKGPAWLQQDHYDIAAKADPPASEDEMKLMMRTLLAERFQLAFTRERREGRALALTVAKSGHKLKRAEGGTPVRQNTASGTIAKAMTMREFANFLAGPLRTPVVDRTGLDGRYDFELDFTPYLPADGSRPDVATLLMAALREELGLKLESQRMAVEVMMIQRVEKPSAN